VVFTSSSRYFLDTASTNFIFGTCLITLFTLLFNIYRAVRLPNLFDSNSRLLNLNSHQLNNSWESDLFIGNLSPYHRFIVFRGSLVASRSDLDRIQELEIPQRIITQKDDIEVGRSGDDRSTVTVTFFPGDRYSTPFRLGRASLGDCDEVNLSIGIHTDLRDVVAFQFSWDFFNPSAEDSARHYLFTLSFLLAYLTLFFSWHVHLNSDLPSQIFLLVLGISGVFAANPFAWLFSPRRYLGMRDHFLMSFFIALFRTFLIAQLELVHRETLSTASLFVMALFFSGHATIDVAASYDRATHWRFTESQPYVILPSEKVLVIGDLIYIGVLMIELIGAFKSPDSEHDRLLGLLGGVGIITGGVTIWAHSYCILTGLNMYSLVPMLIYGTTHLTIVSFMLYFLRADIVSVYATVAKKSVEVVLTLTSDSGGDEEEDGEEG
jgi:hypothetical protein